jgi:type I restriction enzyme M protein
MLVEEQKLDAVISLPGGVFKPYAGVSTAILLFTKTNSGGTDHVWFYDVQADGQSLDDKRTELLPPEKLGPVPTAALTEPDHAKNNLPDVLARWRTLGVPASAGKASLADHISDSSKTTKADHPSPPKGGTPNEAARPRTAQSFFVPKADIAAQNYDLSLNRYKEVIHEEIAHRPPGEILARLAELEKDITQGMKELEGMLGVPPLGGNAPIKR